MATKKTTPSAPAKKPAATPSPAKKATPAKASSKAASAPKKAESSPKATPAKKAAPAKAPVKKAAPAPLPVKKATPAKKAAPAKAPAKKAAPAPLPVKKATPAKKAAPAKAPAKKAQPKKEESVKPTAAQPAPEPAPAPAAKEKAPAKKGAAVLKDSERERIKKFKATLAALRAEPGWKAFLAEQKKLLISMRDQLLPNMQNVTRDHLRSGDSNVSSSSGQHIGDAGSEAEQRDITILRLDKDREQLFEIDAALQRIEKGTYGICEISLEPIPRKRLQVRPFCRLTVKCQEEYEKKYGSISNYRSKNSGDVGFSGLQKVIESTIMLDEDEE